MSIEEVNVPRNRAERRAAERRRRAAAGVTATKVGALVASTAAAAFGWGALPASGNAAIVVTNTNDTGAGSLRDAITTANSTSGADVITFQAGLTGTITLTTGQLPKITEALSIQGPGASTLTVQGVGTARSFYINAASTFDVTISGLTVTHDATTVTGNGGGIFNNRSHLTLANDVITANKASGKGGGVYSHTDTNAVMLTNSTVSNNTAASGGGGVYVVGERAELDVTNSAVSGNTSTTGWGGGLYFYSESSVLSITGSTFTNNTAHEGGGGAWLDGFSSVATVSNTTVTGNTATNEGGGGFYIGNDDITVTSSTFSGNTAGVDGGGGVRFEDNDTQIKVTGSTFSNNTVNKGGQGGGLYFDNPTGPTTISGSTISGNIAAGNGGGVYLNDVEGTTSITDSKITNNTSGGYGGGISLYYESASFTVDRTTISGNTALGGGGVFLYSDFESQGQPTIKNSTISGNTASTGWGGGLYIGGLLNTARVLNSTISGNTAQVQGGGISFLGYYGLSLVQDTITNNTANNQRQVPTSAVTTPAVGGLYIGGNISVGAVRSQAHAAHAQAHIDRANATDKKDVHGDVKTKKVRSKHVHSALASKNPVSGETSAIGTILAGNHGSDVGIASVVDSNHSLFGTVSGTTIHDLGGTQQNVADAKLGPLANNGGPTMTHALLSGSPAIDTGPVPASTSTSLVGSYDQRGAPYARVQGTAIDIGAFEVQVPVVVIQPKFTG